MNKLILSALAAVGLYLVLKGKTEAKPPPASGTSGDWEITIG